MRAFIAVDLPESLKNHLSQIQEDLKTCNLECKWMKPESIHLTLKFLGDIDQKQLGQIKTILKQITSNFSCFEVNVDGFGFFPNEKRPRVFFLSTSEQERLKSIVDQLEKELEKIGFPIEDRFRSHLTLARIKSLKNIELLKEKTKDIKMEGKLTVKELVLYKSTLTPRGAIYERIASSPLAA